MLDQHHANTDIFDVCVEEFDSRVIEASHKMPIMVDLWAEWCTPCLLIAPKLKELVAEHKGRLKLAKVEVDEGHNMKLAGKYRVRGFPTVILFHEGEEKARFHGSKPLYFLREFVQEYV